MNDELERFLEWFDSIIEPDGTINLDKHPELVNFIQNPFGINRKKYIDIQSINNLGETINYKFECMHLDEND